jgi:hypothetical protein
VSVALAGGSDWHSLTGSGGAWSGTLSTGISAPAPLPSADAQKKVNRTITGHAMQLRARNRYGVDMALIQVGAVVAAPTDAPITSVEAAREVVTVGETIRITVETSDITSAAPTVSGMGGADSVTDIAGGKRWVFYGTAGAPAGQFESRAFTVSVKDRNGGTFTVQNAAIVVVRQTNYAFLDVTMGPTYFVGTSGSVHVDVQTLSPDAFLAGDRYLLKSNPTAAEYGNFFAIDLGDPGGSTYRENIIHGSPELIYVGQTLYTETGNMVGPTGQGCDGRFGDDSCGYDAWMTAGKPSCPRLVYIPITEWKESPNGKTPCVVTGFAAFFIEETQSASGDVSVYGRFVEYVGSGVPGPVPDPTDKAVKTARLVADGVSF